MIKNPSKARNNLVIKMSEICIKVHLITQVCRSLICEAFLQFLLKNLKFYRLSNLHQRHARTSLILFHYPSLCWWYRFNSILACTGFPCIYYDIFLGSTVHKFERPFSRSWQICICLLHPGFIDNNLIHGNIMPSENPVLQTHESACSQLIKAGNDREKVCCRLETFYSILFIDFRLP